MVLWENGERGLKDRRRGDEEKGERGGIYGDGRGVGGYHTPDRQLKIKAVAAMRKAIL